VKSGKADGQPALFQDDQLRQAGLQESWAKGKLLWKLK